MGRNLGFFQFAGPLYEDKGIYDDWHLASLSLLSASLLWVLEYIWEEESAGFFPVQEAMKRIRAYIGVRLEFFKSQGLCIGRKVYTTIVPRFAWYFALLGPKTYTGGEVRNFSKSHSLSGES